MENISIRGARTHNLKNIDLDLPRDRLIVITGLSGSGKSSLAFDTIYAEGQRRYVESLSAYARQFLSIMDKPDVDHIEGLSPAISIEQKSTSHNPRSTVGTITEIHDYLRLLFARVGIPRCPDHGIELNAQTVSQMVDNIMAFAEGSKWMLIAPLVQGRKGEHTKLLQDMQQQGFVRARIDGDIYELDALPAIDGRRKHDIGIVVDRFAIRDGIAQRLAESLETALALADGIVQLVAMDGDATHTFSAKYACPVCGYALSELEPRLFSFNNPHGACPECDGLGVNSFIDPARVVMHPYLSIAAGAVPQAPYAAGIGAPPTSTRKCRRWLRITTSTSKKPPLKTCRTPSRTSSSTAAAAKKSRCRPSARAARCATAKRPTKASSTP